MQIENNRKQLIYDTARESIIQARIKISQLIKDDALRSNIDNILFQTSNQCCKGVIVAAEINMRERPTGISILGQIEQ